MDVFGVDQTDPHRCLRRRRPRITTPIGILGLIGYISSSTQVKACVNLPRSTEKHVGEDAVWEDEKHQIMSSPSDQSMIIPTAMGRRRISNRTQDRRGKSGEQTWKKCTGSLHIYSIDFWRDRCRCFRYFQCRRYPDGMRVVSTEIGLELLDGDAHRIGWGLLIRAPLKRKVHY